MASRTSLFKLEPTDCPVHVQEHVRWGDMDAFAHMNNMVFFQLFESARMAYFERIQFSDPAQNAGIGPILAYTECHYLKPLVYPQKLTVGTRVTALQEDRLIMEYGVFIEQTPTLAACGTGKVVSFNYAQGKKTPIPEAVVDRIHAVEGDAPRDTMVDKK